jgi:hypothetical protein
MKKFIENENEEEPNDTRYSLDLQKKEKDSNHIMFQSQSFLKGNRPLSAKPLLLYNFTCFFTTKRLLIIRLINVNLAYIFHN